MTRIGKIYKTAPPGVERCKDRTYTDRYLSPGVCAYHGGLQNDRKKTQRAKERNEVVLQEIEKPDYKELKKSKSITPKRKKHPGNTEPRKSNYKGGVKYIELPKTRQKTNLGAFVAPKIRLSNKKWRKGEFSASYELKLALNYILAKIPENLEYKNTDVTLKNRYTLWVANDILNAFSSMRLRTENELRLMETTYPELYKLMTAALDNSFGQDAINKIIENTLPPLIKPTTTRKPSKNIQIAPATLPEYDTDRIERRKEVILPEPAESNKLIVASDDIKTQHKFAPPTDKVVCFYTDNPICANWADRYNRIYTYMQENGLLYTPNEKSTIQLSESFLKAMNPAQKLTFYLQNLHGGLRQVDDYFFKDAGRVEQFESKLQQAERLFNEITTAKNEVVTTIAPAVVEERKETILPEQSSFDPKAILPFRNSLGDVLTYLRVYVANRVSDAVIFGDFDNIELSGPKKGLIMDYRSVSPYLKGIIANDKTDITEFLGKAYPGNIEDKKVIFYFDATGYKQDYTSPNYKLLSKHMQEVGKKFLIAPETFKQAYERILKLGGTEVATIEYKGGQDTVVLSPSEHNRVYIFCANFSRPNEMTCKRSFLLGDTFFEEYEIFVSKLIRINIKDIYRSAPVWVGGAEMAKKVADSYNYVLIRVLNTEYFNAIFALKSWNLKKVITIGSDPQALGQENGILNIGTPKFFTFFKPLIAPTKDLPRAITTDTSTQDIIALKWGNASSITATNGHAVINIHSDKIIASQVIKPTGESSGIDNIEKEKIAKTILGLIKPDKIKDIGIIKANKIDSIITALKANLSLDRESIVDIAGNHLRVAILLPFLTALLAAEKYKSKSKSISKDIGLSSTRVEATGTYGVLFKMIPFDQYYFFQNDFIFVGGVKLLGDSVPTFELKINGLNNARPFNKPLNQLFIRY